MSGPTLLRAGFLRQTVVNGKKYGPTTAEMAEERPLDHVMKWMESKMMKPARNSTDRVLILESSTGSGKSTVIPPEYYHRFFEAQHKNIACTQPRVLTSVEIPSQSILPYHTREALAAAKQPNRKPLELGKNLGYQNSVLTKKPTRGIIYMTVGVLMQQLNIMADEDFMNKYGILIIDEAHERSVGLDTTLYLLKRFLNHNQKNKDCPLVLIMSATLDVAKFADYMMDDVDATDRYKNIMRVEGFTYPIEDRWLEVTSSNYCTEAVNTVIQIHANYTDFLDGAPEAELQEAEKLAKELRSTKISPPVRVEEDDKKKHNDKKHGGAPKKKLTLSEPKKSELRQTDILIFVNGAADLRRIKKGIEKLNQLPYFQKYPVMPLELTSDAVTSQNPDYRALFQDINKLAVAVNSRDGGTKLLRPVRRVVVSTNVAETGVTIDTLRYVIDTGFYKSAEFCPTIGVSMLINKPVTQSMHRQRRGRVGRKGEGISYSLFTQETYDALHVMQYPDIVKDQVVADILTIIIRETDHTSEMHKARHLREAIDEVYPRIFPKSSVSLNELPLMDAPSTDSLHYSLDKLFLLGFIDANCIPTQLGIVASKFRFVSLECIKMILAGYAWGAPIIDLITLAAFLQFPKNSVFIGLRESSFLHAERAGEFNLFNSRDQKRSPEGAYQDSEKTRMFMADDFLRLLVVFREVSNQIQELESSLFTAEESDEELEVAKVFESTELETTSDTPVKPEEPTAKPTEVVKPEEPAATSAEDKPATSVYADKTKVGENTSIDDSDNIVSADPVLESAKAEEPEEAKEGGAESNDEVNSDSDDDEVYFGGGDAKKKHNQHKDSNQRSGRPKSPLEQYLGDRGINYSGFLQVIERRDEIIQMMASMGFNPFHGWHDSIEYLTYRSEADKLSYVQKVKQCLYEGFKCNVAAWDASVSKFSTLKSHLPLNIESDLMRFQPKFIIYDSILMIGDSNEMYEAKINYLGILDGFVEIDTNFEAVVGQL